MGLLDGRVQAKAPLAEGGALPSLGATRPRLRKPGRPFGAHSPQREGTEESPLPDANTAQAAACQLGLPRTTPWLLNMGAERAAPPALPGLRMALIVCARPTRAHRHGAAGPWPPTGTCQRPSDGLYLSLLPRRALDVLWVSPNPDSGGRCYLVVGRLTGSQ